jgi:peptide/nickel transport system substrate-binding protein
MGLSDLIMRRDQNPGNKPDFALAIKHLFDREQMKKVVALDYAVIASDQLIDPTICFYFGGLPQRTIDLGNAKFYF